MNYRDNLEREVTLCPTATGGGVELSRDFILPDSYADIKRVLGVTAMLSPSGGYADGGKAYYSGEISTQVLFLTEEGRPASLVCPLSYDDMTVLGGEEGEYEALFMPCVATLTVRAVNPRKLGVKARLEPSLYAFERRDADLAFAETVTEQDLESFQEKTETFPYLTARSLSAKGIEAGDDILIEEAYLPVGEILNTAVSFSHVTAEAREDGVAVSGNAEVAVLYQNEAGTPVLRRHTVPLSTLAPCEGVKEGDAVAISLYCQGVSCRVGENAAAEARVIELDLTYALEGAVFREETGVAVKDLYSTQYECEALTRSLPVATRMERVEGSLRVVGEMPCEEKGEVLGSYTSFTPLSLVKREGEVWLQGDLLLTILLLSDEGVLFSRTLEMPLSRRVSFSADARCETLTSATADQVHVTLSGDLLSAEATVGLHGLIWEVAEEEMIVSVRVLSRVEEDHGGLFTVYFPSAGESGWEIAKRYRVPEERLIFSEGTSGGRRRVLILPRERRPFYRGTLEG